MAEPILQLDNSYSNKQNIRAKPFLSILPDGLAIKDSYHASPMLKLSEFNSPRDSITSISPLKHFDPKNERSENEEMYLSLLNEMIDEKQIDCLKLIEDGLNNKVNISFKEHEGCDKQEFGILSLIEYLVFENNIEEAIRAIRWRKTILKISKMSNWQVANDIAKTTIKKLEVTPDDYMEGILKAVSSGIEYLT